MIFFSLGTQDKPFKRLIDYCEKLDTDEKIVVQNGLTDYKSDKLILKRFLSPEELDKAIDDASVVITHGGVGTIINCLNKGKKIIACPRLSKFHEHHNDHQCEIIDEFEKDGYLIALREGDDINEIIKKARNFSPKKYTSNTSNFIKKLDEYLENI